MATIGLNEGWNMLISIIDSMYTWLIFLTLWNIIITVILFIILFVKKGDSE